ncbi:hypothetical protein COOONC_04013 [Cooperia oncophora]
MSPKAPTNQRKKSSGFTEADRRLARAQQLMDADLEQHTGPCIGGSCHPHRTSLAPTFRLLFEESARRNVVKVAIARKVNMLVKNPSLFRSLLSATQRGPRRASNFGDSSSAVSPPPSMSLTHPARQLHQLRTTYPHQGELREMSAEFAARTRRRSESEQSVASELSAAPDWLDDVSGARDAVLSDDVDDDFSAMAAASEFMMSASGEDGGSSRAQTPQPAVRHPSNAQLQQPQQQKRRGRRDKRRRGGRNSGNDGASSSDKSQRSAIGAERIPKKTLAAQLNEERRRREDEYLRSNNAGNENVAKDFLKASKA